MREIAKRYALMVGGLFFSALGIAFTKRAALGVSPISSVANVLSCKFTTLSLGTWLILWNGCLILGQALILRKNFQKVQILQIPVTILLGWFTDLGVQLVSWIPVNTYPVQILMVLVGIVICGFGVSLSVIADVIMNPSDAFVKVISDVSCREFGNAKILVDMVCVMISVILSLLFFRFTIVGAREGTVISAFLTGTAAKFFDRKLREPLTTILRS